MNRHNLFISNFRKSILFFFKLFVLMFFIIIFCIHSMPQYANGYCASLIDKVKRLESIDEPKIVLIGNSNLAFRIQSEIIEEELGMPVANMGMHANLGNVFHEEMARLNVTEGDIYVLCHSSFADDGKIMDPAVAWITIENNKNLFKILRYEDILPMIKAYPIYLRKCLDLYIEETGNEDSGGVYSRNAFNQYGDLCFDHSETTYAFTEEVRPPDINDNTIYRINSLYEWLNERGAALVVAGYPIGKGENTVDESEFVEFQKKLEDKLICPVISDYRDYMFDYDLFYNSKLHLTNEGAELRTRQLVVDLKAWINNSNS